MRLIDADKLIEDICEDCGGEIRESCKNSYLCASAMWVAEAPTVDAVEVVRCKDCIGHKRCEWERVLGYYGYCSKGERRCD